MESRLGGSGRKYPAKPVPGGPWLNASQTKVTPKAHDPEMRLDGAEEYRESHEADSLVGIAEH
jgi:hypothetical protein